jgi:hypothetical protein
MGTPSPEFRARMDDLITDLRQLIVENTTNQSIDLSIAQLRGSADWDSKERYPSLAAFAREEKTRAPFARAMSGQNIPILFEHLLARSKRTDRLLPKIYRRVWDNTYWWADAVCSRTLWADHSAGAPLLRELVRRADVVDVLASVPRLIEPLPAKHHDETVS